MITVIEHEVSAQLAGELREIARLAAADQSFDRYRSAADHYRDFAASVRGLELLARVDDARGPLSILDIGAGNGESTLLLADRGHRVSCLEPSPELCRVVDTLATRFGCDVRVYQGTAEAAHALPAASFDACIFNASLHHCEHPVTALENCRALLRAGGRVIVVNEPLLRFYRSHAWFARRLRSHPVEMGHYGGNEHSYHHGEYVAMLRRAGFGRVQASLSVRNSEPQLALRDLRWREIGGRRVYGDGALLVRLVWLTALKHVLRAGAVGRALTGVAMRLSLVHTSYVAVKP